MGTTSKRQQSTTLLLHLLLYYCAFIHTAYSQDDIPLKTPLVLVPCGEYDNYQNWRFDNSSGKYTIFSLKAYPYNANGTCIGNNGGQVGKIPYTFTCGKNTKNEEWTLIKSTQNNVILQATVNGSTCIELINQYDTAIKFCNTSTILQQFTLDPSKGYISAAMNKSLCLTVGYFNCSMSGFKQLPYCDVQLPVDQRVDDLVSRMTLYEKVQNLQRRGTGVGIPRLGVPANIFNEALHGVNCNCGETYKGNTGCATSYPHATLLGSTFNRSLWRTIGAAISTEARAFANQGITGLFFYAPDINLFRDPRWGRGQEVPGEDPFLTGQYVMEYSYNMQFGEDEKYLKVVSTAKHYADYDQEGNYGTIRQAFNANVSMQDQVEYYWPAWRSAIQTGQVKSIMCSYNAVNNVPSCGNDYFMNQVARKEWGFDGFFVSDCGAIGDTAFKAYVSQLYPNSSNTVQELQLARIAIQGGCDNNCGTYYNDYLQQSVESGYTSLTDIDIASKRVWKRTIELGKLDFNNQGKPSSYYTTYGADKIDTIEHRNLALNAAEQGIILLKNENNFLPLSIQNMKGKSIALIGPHANSTQDMLSNYHGTNILVDSNSPFFAFKNMNIDVTYTQGCDVQCNTSKNFTSAISAASNADYAIVFLGLTPNGKCAEACEREGWDRNTIEFPGYQLLLLQKVYATNKNTILVLINGGALDLTWPKANVGAIVEAFYPGELGGPAIANIIFGKAAPAGKLDYTIYDKSFLTTRPTIMDMSLRNNGGITYRYYTGTPVYKFGYGLYYTNFSYTYYNSSNERFVDTKLLADFYRNGYYFYKSEATSFVVEVTNIGNVASDCVVLGFVTSNDPDAPLIKLFDFQRVFVDVKQSVNVTLSVSPESISITNKYGNERIVPGIYNLYIGDYQNNNYIHTNLILTGEEESIFSLKKSNKQTIL